MTALARWLVGAMVLAGPVTIWAWERWHRVRGLVLVAWEWVG